MATTAQPGGGGTAPVLAVDDSGAGPADTIVLIHGLATTRVIWRLVIPLLSQDRRVVALDVPGFGASPAAGAGFDLTRVAERIAQGLSARGVTAPFDLVGHSMGGAVALRLASGWPELVRRLVLVAPAGLSPLPVAAANLLAVAGDRMIVLRRRASPLARWRAGRRLLLNFGVSDPDAIEPDDVRAMASASLGATRVREALATVGRSEMRDDIAAVAAPLGAIWGEHDRVIPPARIGALLACRPEAVVAIVPRSGHIAMMERPQAFAQTLDEVLARLAQPARQSFPSGHILDDRPD